MRRKPNEELLPINCMRHRTIPIFIIFTIVASVLVIDTKHSAYACTCVQPRTPAEELNASSAVFSGKVIDIASEASEKAIWGQ